MSFDPNIRYTIRGLSHRQLYTLAEGVELANRLSLGQFESVAEFISAQGVTAQDGSPISVDVLELARKKLDELKLLVTGFGGGASKGIGSPYVPLAGKVGWELYKVMRHRMAWSRNPEGDFTVDFDDPYQPRYSVEPMAEVVVESSAGTREIDELPPDCFLGRRNGEWTVVYADREASKAWLVVGTGSTSGAAVTKAKAYFSRKAGTNTSVF